MYNSKIKGHEHFCIRIYLLLKPNDLLFFLFLVGCPSDSIFLPPIDDVIHYPLTLLGGSYVVTCQVASETYNITRVCTLNGEWLDPDYQSCTNAKFKHISDQLYQVETLKLSLIAHQTNT